MPRLKSTATLRNDLGAVAFEYAADAVNRGFIADAVLPVFDSPEKSSDYPVIPSEAFMKLYETKRAPRAKYSSSDYEFDSGSFSCEEHGWEEFLDDSEANLYRRYFDLEEVGTKRAVDILLRNREKRVADLLLNESTFAHDAVSVAWSELEACDPRTDVKTIVTLVKNTTGIKPNAVIISEEKFDQVVSCKAFQEACKYTDQILLKDEEYQKVMVAKFFGVKRVIVAGEVYDTAKKGQPVSTSGIWTPTKAMVCRIAENPRDLREPCVGRSFLWTGDSPQILTTETYRAESNRANVVRVRHNIDEAAVFTACGYILTGL